MCGIVAIFSPTTPLPPDVVHRATQALAHRGPDGCGFWQSSDGRVALGHTRLSIIDPDGQQPLASEDHRRQLVVNGEFYDYESIRRELRQRGHQLRTRSDSEIAVHLYEEKGVGCLLALRGEFAFVLWDEPRQTLFAARDRFGIKPLFYAQVGEVVYLASEIKALLAAGVPAAWDEETVYQTLHLCFDASRSLFRGIRQLPPAHWLLVSAGGVQLQRYWDIAYPRRSALAQRFTEAECISQVRALVNDAVRVRLQADVPVGCLLSGGLDSSSVLALAAAQSARPVAAFTIAFNQLDYDESALAQDTARQLGADFHVLRLSDRDLADHFADAVWHGEMLQYNAHGTARFLLSRAIHQAGYKSVMAGEGADELFAGYAFVRAALPTSPSGVRWPAWLGMGLRLLRPPTPDQKQLAHISPWLARLSRLFGFVAPAVATLTERIGVMRGVLAPGFVAAFRGYDPYERLYQSLDQRAALPQWEPAKQMLYLWLRTIFANYHMASDRLDMAHAVEVRLPFLDHGLFEYASQIPAGLLAKDGQNKFVLREAMQPYIPPAVYRRIKKPFLAPPAAAQPGNPLHDFVQDTLRRSTFPYFDRSALIRLLDRLPNWTSTSFIGLEALLMGVVSLEILHKRYCASNTARP